MKQMKALLQSKAGNRRIVLVGFGREGQSSLRFLLASYWEHPIAVADQNTHLATHPLITEHNIPFFGGADFEQALHTDDFIIKSPGVKLYRQFEHLHSQTALFLECYGSRIIGITGTKGKSTTATMTHQMLQACGKHTLLIGNIGIPSFEALGQIQEDTLIVQELSAHQLQDIQHSCRYAILLNLMPEHLDFFGSVEAYYAAKLRLFTQQDDKHPFRYMGNSCHTYTSYTNSSAHCELADNVLIIQQSISLQATDLLYLRGAHHLENICAIIELAIALDLPLEIVLDSIKHFKPLPHRQSILGTKDGCTFINDSISTIPQATIAALKSFPNTTHLILGGVDRGINYDELLSVLAASKLKKVYFLGKSGARMWDEFQKTYESPSFDIFVGECLQDIEKEIIDIKNATILLSPAAASYDHFVNFEARGDYFKKIFEKK